MSTRLHKWLTFMIICVLPGALVVTACGDDEPDIDPSSGPSTTSVGGGGTGGSGGQPQGICLLNNCSDDLHCVGCPDDRDICLIEENRCVACIPGTTDGCAEGEECSSFGICVPAGLTCPSDGEGNPTVVCVANADCKACSPMHQVCDTDTGKCQACTETNTQHCLSSDICIDTDNDGNAETCSPKCPQVCDEDNDCGLCGQGTENPATACFNHKCAECSDTFPCAAGEECIHGVCQGICGLPGPVAGTCTNNADCQFCGNVDNTWTCKTPVNDPNHGKCVPPANGCSDIGNGVVVLPPPFDQYTQTCSNDADCTQAGAGVDFNVGEAIRDLIGSDSIDLGFTEVDINDAIVTYAMPVCAEIEITGDIDCSICVPCEQDSDCAPIDIDPLIIELFQDDAIGIIAGALLIDLIYGDNEDHQINFFCQEIAAGYGACVPCGNPAQPCGDTGGPGTGSCDHTVCQTGTAMNSSCSSCAAQVCAADAYCCDGANGAWDSLCVDEADDLCGGICSGGTACAHDPCTEGTALQASCGQCVADICAADPFCCNQQSGSWDSLCVKATDPNESSYQPSCANACGGGCIHSECVTGPNLDPGCSACAGSVCAGDSYCCDTDWDSICVDAAEADSNCSCP